MEKKGTKLLVLIILLALIGGVIFLLVSNKNKGKSSSVEDVASTRSTDYFAKLTMGYDSKYNGIDMIYTKDKTTIEDLDNGMMLTAAYYYIINPKNKVDNITTPQEHANLQERYDLNNSIILKGKEVREAIKVLFGIDYDNSEYSSDSFKYSFIYDKKSDMYIKREKTNSQDNNYIVLTKVISTKKKDDLITTQIAVGYVVRNDKENTLYSDAANTKEIKKLKKITLNDLTDKEVEKLSKFNINTKEVEGNNVFESIEAVK